MGVVISPDSELGKELAKWNKPHDIRDPHNHFPRMLYMAQTRPDGVSSVCETNDDVFAGKPGAAEAFNGRCQRIVQSEQEERIAEEQGWRHSPAEAMERHESKEKSIADAAAHRAYEDRNMSDAAKVEIAAAEAETAGHVPEVKQKRKYTKRPA